MLAIFNMIGGPELVVLLIVGLILFGGRLPDVGKSVGKSLIQFRKGLRDLKQDIGLDEVTDLRRDLGQLTQAHYNLLDVNDDELEDRKENLENSDDGSEGPEENPENEVGTTDNLEAENSKVLGQPSGKENPGEKGSEEQREQGANGDEVGPFAREDADSAGEPFEDLGIPMPHSEEQGSDGADDPPKFGYKS